MASQESFQIGLWVHDVVWSISFVSVVSAVLNIYLFDRYRRQLRCSMNYLLMGVTMAALLQSLFHLCIGLASRFQRSATLSLPACMVLLTSTTVLLTLQLGFLALYYAQILLILRYSESSASRYAKYLGTGVGCLAIFTGIYTAETMGSRHDIIHKNDGLFCHLPRTGFLDDIIVPGILEICVLLACGLVVIHVWLCSSMDQHRCVKNLKIRGLYVCVMVVAQIFLILSHHGTSHVSQSVRTLFAVFGLCCLSGDAFILLMLFIWTEGIWEKYKHYRQCRERVNVAENQGQGTMDRGETAPLVADTVSHGRSESMRHGERRGISEIYGHGATTTNKTQTATDAESLFHPFVHQEFDFHDYSFALQVISLGPPVDLDAISPTRRYKFNQPPSRHSISNSNCKDSATDSQLGHPTSQVDFESPEELVSGGQSKV